MLINFIVALISLGFMSLIDGIKENNKISIRVGKIIINLAWILNVLNAYGILK